MTGRKSDRNAPCPCGSGRKLKRCCAGRLRRRQRRNVRLVRLAGAALVVGIGIGAFALFRSWDGAESSGSRRVWSAEHGHWHTVEDEAHATRSSRPPGPAPPGKVWSASHGHWHDAP